MNSKLHEFEMSHDSYYMTVSVRRMSKTAGLYHQSPGWHFPHFLSFPCRGIPARPQMVPTSQHGFHPKMDGHVQGWQGQSCHHRDASFLPFDLCYQGYTF